MINCTKIIEFDAAHRVCSLHGYCEHLHGHRYKVEFTFSAEELDKNGMVIDFTMVKKLAKEWIDKNLDHNVMLSKNDMELGMAIEKITGQKIFFMNETTTAENLAILLLNLCNDELFKDFEVKCTKVKVWESPTSWAEYVISQDHGLIL